MMREEGMCRAVVVEECGGAVVDRGGGDSKVGKQVED